MKFVRGPTLLLETKGGAKQRHDESGCDIQPLSLCLNKVGPRWPTDRLPCDEVLHVQMNHFKLATNAAK